MTATRAAVSSKEKPASAEAPSSERRTKFGVISASNLASAAEEELFTCSVS
eukprot:CAMPEP_0115625710 /NCGR_PEP_ID=MMETSP0272-20121206/27960_1 /TAXON_ID=71861 /ORGANISM="Scrippsiella trochoidea, Strain CCMP3099" /LENGTH=50 /DNA_ID=CAMNT_0003062025 /DNA_START=136 /DNA_END=284 /DNA_ORIENTATION=+